MRGVEGCYFFDIALITRTTLCLLDVEYDHMIYHTISYFDMNRIIWHHIQLRFWR